MKAILEPSDILAIERFFHDFNDMRTLQKKFFAGDRSVVARAKKLEKDVDNQYAKLVDKIFLKPPQEPPNPAQATIF